MEAVAILKEMNRLGGRKVPADAPAGFVPAKYAGYLEKARKSGEDTAYRHYWELCVTLCLRDGLRSGDVFVPGSRRYADPSTYLYTPRQWAPRQEEYCRLVGKPAAAAHALEQGKEELHAALAELESVLADSPPGDRGTVRLDGADGGRATHARYPVHHLTEAGMARKIAVVIDEDLEDDRYVDFGNGIWGALKMALPEGGFHLVADRNTTVGYPNERWAQHGDELPWQ
jgi:hypothetical protein